MRFLAYPILQLPIVLWLYRRLVLPLIIRRVRARRTINVVFLAINPDMWRYDGLFRKLLEDARFKPTVLTAMRNNDSEAMLVDEQERMVAYFGAKGYPVIRGYDASTRKWLDLDSLEPDFVFHAQPYRDIYKNPAYDFYRHLSALHGYAPYSFQMCKAAWNWNNPLQNYAWRQFLVGPYQLGISREMSNVKGRNATAAGYSMSEELKEVRREEAELAWRGDQRKRVIWAPHHSVGDWEMFRVSSFLEIADEMLKIREEYKDRVLFAFKPHPVLKEKLQRVWGPVRTAEYWAKWEESEDAIDAQGDYHALFVGSDALIHCSGSFIVEYLMTEKPVQYVFSKNWNPPELGEIGEAALGAHYAAHSTADIRRFLDETVLGGKDPKTAERRSVIDKYLVSPDGRSFSEILYREMTDAISGGEPNSRSAPPTP